MPLLPITPPPAGRGGPGCRTPCPENPKAPSPRSRQTCRSGWASLAPIACPGPGAEAAERAGVHPAARLVGVDHAPGVGDEVAAVADHDRVAVEHLAELAVDAHRVKRGAVVVELRRARPRASRPRSRASRLAPRRSVRCGSAPADAAASRIAAMVGAIAPTISTSGLRLAVSVFGAASSQISFASPRRPSRRSPSRKSSGTPITSATSASFRPLPRARREAELVVGRQAAAAHAVEEGGCAERLGERSELVLARAPSRARCRP